MPEYSMQDTVYVASIPSRGIIELVTPHTTIEMTTALAADVIRMLAYHVEVNEKARIKNFGGKRQL